MKRLLPIIGLLTLAATLRGEVVITPPPASVPIGGFCDTTITGLENRDALTYVTVPDIPVRVYAVWGSGDPILSVPTNQVGTWTLIIAYVEGGKPVLRKVPLVIGTGPKPPPDPDPPPDPNPPPPGPVGFRVLILEETADRSRIPATEVEVLTSPAIHGYLKAKTAKGPDGKAPEYRIWDDDFTDQQLANVPDIWRGAYRDAKARSAGRLPWVHVTSGTAGESRELPDTVDEALTLFRKYGGS